MKQIKFEDLECGMAVIVDSALCQEQLTVVTDLFGESAIVEFFDLGDFEMMVITKEDVITNKVRLYIEEPDCVHTSSEREDIIAKALGLPTKGELEAFDQAVLKWEAGEFFNGLIKPTACDCDCCTNYEDEEVTLTFTQDEVLVMAQVLGFVDNDPTIHSVMDKLVSRLPNEMELEDSFDKVDLVVESDLPILDKPIPMQENRFSIKIRK